jgi:hypothetical protein
MSLEELTRMAQNWAREAAGMDLEMRCQLEKV